MSQNKKKYHGWKWSCVKDYDGLFCVYCEVPPGSWGNPSGRSFQRMEAVTPDQARKPEYMTLCIFEQMQKDIVFGLEFQGYGEWLT